MISCVSAQYAYDPTNADEQIPGIRYFGSAKDDRGSLLAGVTVQLSTAHVDFVTVTDEQGRFRTTLPLEMVSALVTPKCFKAGFQSVRVIKLPGTDRSQPCRSIVFFTVRMPGNYCTARELRYNISPAKDEHRFDRVGYHGGRDFTGWRAGHSGTRS